MLNVSVWFKPARLRLLCVVDNHVREAETLDRPSKLQSPLLGRGQACAVARNHDFEEIAQRELGDPRLEDGVDGIAYHGIGEGERLFFDAVGSVVRNFYHYADAGVFVFALACLDPGFLVPRDAVPEELSKHLAVVHELFLGEFHP